MTLTHLSKPKKRAPRPCTATLRDLDDLVHGGHEVLVPVQHLGQLLPLPLRPGGEDSHVPLHQQVLQLGSPHQAKWEPLLELYVLPVYGPLGEVGLLGEDQSLGAGTCPAHHVDHSHKGRRTPYMSQKVLQVSSSG